MRVKNLHTSKTSVKLSPLPRSPPRTRLRCLSYLEIIRKLIPLAFPNHFQFVHVKDLHANNSVVFVEPHPLGVEVDAHLLCLCGDFLGERAGQSTRDLWRCRIKIKAFNEYTDVPHTAAAESQKSKSSPSHLPLRSRPHSPPSSVRIQRRRTGPSP